LKLSISGDGYNALLDTMSSYAKAYNTCATWGFKNHTHNKITCHNGTYYPIRKEIPKLNASLVQCARDCACESLKRSKYKTLPLMKEFGAMRYNQDVIRVVMLHGFASISSISGRIRGEFVIPSYYTKYLNWQVKSSTISLDKRSKIFYLHCQIESRTPETTARISVLGIDRGIVNIAVCSDNTFFNSGVVKNARSKYARLRAELQSKGTRSARRKLRKMSGRERRFVTDVNHCISKKLTNSQFTIFALEDLSKIRVQKRRGKDFNRKLNSWAFYQLEKLLRYKAENLGKQVILVDARFTSQKCSKCGHVYKGNRNGNQFKCKSCGFEIHADLNAARNIANDGISTIGRLPVNQPNVACL
jgi:putative transposase